MTSSSSLPSPSELLQRMVKIDTVNTAFSGRVFPERDLAIQMEALARAAGLATRRLSLGDERFNLLVHPAIRPNAPWLLFESHLDTVGVAGMTIDPFGGNISGGRLWGRGSCDTKATGAAMFCALAAYAASSETPNNVALLFTLDEEAYKTGVEAFGKTQMAPLGWRFSGAVVGEPTGLKPVTAHNGCVRWLIRTDGVAAHSSNPSRGKSAISMMARVIQIIESRYAPSLSASHPLTGRAQCSINQIQGGVAANIIPERCEILLDRRVVPGERAADVLPQVEPLLDELRRADPNLRVTQLTPKLVDPPLDPRGAENFIAAVRGSLRSMNLPDEPCGAPYGTDASNLSDAGVPSVVLGPGDIAQAHTADEWIELSQLDAAVGVYLGLMRMKVGAPA